MTMNIKAAEAMQGNGLLGWAQFKAAEAMQGNGLLGRAQFKAGLNCCVVKNY